MRRFSLYRRGKKRIWYVQFYNPKSKKYLPGRSTGKRNRNAACLVVAEWLRDGIPEPQRGRRPIAEALEVGTVIDTIRGANLTLQDVERIIRALKDQELIDTAVVRAGPGSEGLIAFLNHFWDYEESPYVRE